MAEVHSIWNEIRIINIRDIFWGGLGPRGAQIPHFGRRRRPMKPHISAPKAPKFWKKQCFWPQKRHFRAKKGKNWPFFEKLSIFRKFSNFVRKFSKNFGLDETPQAKKVAQKCNKNENFGGWWNPTEGQAPLQRYLCTDLYPIQKTFSCAIGPNYLA